MCNIESMMISPKLHDNGSVSFYDIHNVKLPYLLKERNKICSCFVSHFVRCLLL